MHSRLVFVQITNIRTLSELKNCRLSGGGVVFDKANPVRCRLVFDGWKAGQAVRAARDGKDGLCMNVQHRALTGVLKNEKTRERGGQNHPWTRAKSYLA